MGSNILLPPASALQGRTPSQAVLAAAQQDLAVGRLPYTPGSLSDMQLAVEGLKSAGSYTQSQLDQTSAITAAAVHPPLTSTPVPKPTAPARSTGTLGGNKPTELPVGDSGDPCDPLSVTFDPIECAGAGGGEGAAPPIVTTTVLEPFNIAVNVSNTINDNLTSAITGAIANLGDQIEAPLEALDGDIYNSIAEENANVQAYTNSLFGALTSTLGNLVTGIGTALGNVFGPIVSGIGGFLGAIKDAIVGLGSAVASQIGTLVDAIKNNGISAIIPVIQLLATEATNVRNIIAAIEVDIKGGVGSLILLPGQLATSLGSIDATLQRAIQQLSTPPGVATNSNIKLGGVDFSANFIPALESLVAGATATTDLSGIYNIISASYNPCSLLDINTQISKLLTWANGLPEWGKTIAGIILSVVQAITTTAGITAKEFEIGLENANKLCPTKKFDAATLGQALLRGYYNSAQFQEELLANGYDSAHATVIQELATQRIDAQTSIDAWFRGIIDDNTLASNLSVLGFSASQIAVLKTQGYANPTLQLANRLYNFQLIDDATFKQLIAQNRYTAQVADLIYQSSLNQTTSAQEAALSGRLNAITGGINLPSLSVTTPPNVVSAAQREGFDAGFARLLWLQHWAFPSWTTMTQSFFRLYRTLPEVHAMMQAENIPPEFWDELINLQRPLIPFRSIPTYLKAGVMSEASAILELTQHGFDPIHIQWILQYAGKTTTATAAATAGTVQALSIATARELFNDGAITQDQYIQVLEAHKFPPDLATLQAEADAMAAHTKQRKQLIADFTDEVLVGTITVDDAMRQLSNYGLTQAELSTFQYKVRSALKKTAKSPSEPQLTKFYTAGIIDLPTWTNEMQKLGWSDPYLSWWIALETPPPTGPAPAPNTGPPANFPGGGTAAPIGTGLVTTTP